MPNFSTKLTLTIFLFDGEQQKAVNLRLKRSREKLPRHATGFHFNFETMPLHDVDGNFIFRHIIFRKSLSLDPGTCNDKKNVSIWDIFIFPSLDVSNMFEKNDNFIFAWKSCNSPSARIHDAQYGHRKQSKKKKTNHNQTLSCTNLFTWIALNLFSTFQPVFSSLRLHCHCIHMKCGVICMGVSPNPNLPGACINLYIYSRLFFIICRCFVFYLRILLTKPLSHDDFMLQVSSVDVRGWMNSQIQRSHTDTDCVYMSHTKRWQILLKIISNLKVFAQRTIYRIIQIGKFASLFFRLRTLLQIHKQRIIVKFIREWVHIKRIRWPVGIRNFTLSPVCKITTILTTVENRIFPILK